MVTTRALRPSLKIAVNESGVFLFLNEPFSRFVFGAERPRPRLWSFFFLVKFHGLVTNAHSVACHCDKIDGPRAEMDELIYAKVKRKVSHFWRSENQMLSEYQTR